MILNAISVLFNYSGLELIIKKDLDLLVIQTERCREILKKLTLNPNVKDEFIDSEISVYDYIYEIVKSYRGRVNAFFWQTMARIWENNLKTKYDPLSIREDMLIEHIITQEKLEERLEHLKLNIQKEFIFKNRQILV